MMIILHSLTMFLVPKIILILTVSSVMSQTHWQPSSGSRPLVMENEEQPGLETFKNDWTYDKSLTMQMKRNWVYDNGLLKRLTRSLKRKAMRNGKIRLL